MSMWPAIIGSTIAAALAFFGGWGLFTLDTGTTRARRLVGWACCVGGIVGGLLSLSYVFFWASR